MNLGCLLKEVFNTLLNLWRHFGWITGITVTWAGVRAQPGHTPLRVFYAPHSHVTQLPELSAAKVKSQYNQAATSLINSVHILFLQFPSWHILLWNTLRLEAKTFIARKNLSWEANFISGSISLKTHLTFLNNSVKANIYSFVFLPSEDG